MAEISDPPSCKSSCATAISAPPSCKSSCAAVISDSSSSESSGTTASPAPLSSSVSTKTSSANPVPAVVKASTAAITNGKSFFLMPIEPPPYRASPIKKSATVPGPEWAPIVGPTGLIINFSIPKRFLICSCT